MKQFLTKTTLLLLTGFLLAHTAYLAKNTTDSTIVCASTDTSNSISLHTAFGDASEHTLIY